MFVDSLLSMSLPRFGAWQPCRSVKRLVVNCGPKGIMLPAFVFANWIVPLLKRSDGKKVVEE